jgi:hypothetical protein
LLKTVSGVIPNLVSRADAFIRAGNEVGARSAQEHGYIDPAACCEYCADGFPSARIE